MTNNLPKVSIVIATFNSQKTLSFCLEAIDKQDYPKKRIEVLVVDGGSTDSTKEIAKNFNCKIINNPKKDPVPAKYLGYLNAKGRYLLYLDSDEIIQNPKSLKLKISIFLTNSKVKAVIPTGYIKPKNTAAINYYINEFGDPFSFFIYKLSKDKEYFIKSLKQKYLYIIDDKDYIAFDFNRAKQLPILELIAMGSMVDLKYLKSQFPQIKKDATLIPHFFYLLNSKPTLVAITKNDGVLHESADTLFRYLKKINSRIKNNIFQTTMGIGGFSGRNKYQPFWLRLKKFLFIPYSLLIFLPLMDSVYLTLSRRKSVYLLHMPLCIYTSLVIIYYYALKVFGVRPQTKGYGI